MKDYTQLYNGKYSQDDFILNYEIKDDKITVTLANGTKYLIKYSEENEKTLLNAMKEQTKNFYFTTKYFTKHKIINSLSVLALNMCNIILYTSVIGLNINIYGWLSYLFVGINVIVFFAEISKIIKIIKIKNDLNKNIMFLTNEKLFNENLTIQNIKEYGKALKKIEINSEVQTLNINNIDKISLRKLRKLKEDINTYLVFGINPNDKSKEAKTKVRALEKTLKNVKDARYVHNKYNN